jgi:hypothetical protein
MLDTLLQIGKTFREAGRLKHHRYIKPAPMPDPKGKTAIKYLSLPVRVDFTFDFANITEIPENERSSLYYFTFKTSDADGFPKYFWGDLLYGIDAKEKESGNYRFKEEKEKKKGKEFDGAFFKAKKYADDEIFRNTRIEKFRANFERQIGEIESIIKENLAHENSRTTRLVYINFKIDGKHWYEFQDEMDLLNRKILNEFFAFSLHGLALRKSLYKTISAPEEDLQFPNFTDKGLHKVRIFKHNEQAMDLVYAIDYSKKAIISEKNIKIVVFPKGENLKPEDIEDFFEKKSAVDDEEIENSEKKVKKGNIKEEEINFDSFFKPFVEEVPESIVQFDFVFSKKSDSLSAPDVDMVEISGIERSLLVILSERIREIRSLIFKERNALYPKRPKNFINLDIRNAFKNILGDTTKGQKKYQSHLFKVLPQIYTGTYYRDDVLLHAFIKKVEFNIRNDNENYNLLKYDYYFLTKIQNSTTDRIMEMENSLSYKAGTLLGKMAKSLNQKINSFQKNYVGLLSRRIADKRSLIEFANFINEKLAIHDVAYPDLQQASVEFAEIVSKMSDKEYLKNECAFGFFESYFKYEPKKTDEQSQNSEPDLFNN